MVIGLGIRLGDNGLNGEGWEIRQKSLAKGKRDKGWKRINLFGSKFKKHFKVFFSR